MRNRRCIQNLLGTKIGKRLRLISDFTLSRLDENGRRGYMSYQKYIKRYGKNTSNTLSVYNLETVV